MPTRVWIVPGPEWKATAAKLRVVEEKLPGWVEKELKETLDPVVKRAKAAVRQVDVQGGPTRHTGMRNRIAAGVGVRKGISTKGSAYFTIFSDVNDPSMRPIPRGLDEASGWRHPLFGNKNYWYQSRPTRPGWFSDTIGDSADEIERGIGNALDTALKLF